MSVASSILRLLTVILPFIVCWFTKQTRTMNTSPEPQAEPKSSPEPGAKLSPELKPELKPEPRSELKSEENSELKPEPSGPEPLNQSSNIWNRVERWKRRQEWSRGDEEMEGENNYRGMTNGWTEVGGGWNTHRSLAMTHTNIDHYKLRRNTN